MLPWTSAAARRRRRTGAAPSAATSTLETSSFAGNSGTLTFTARDVTGAALDGVDVNFAVDAEALISAALSVVTPSTGLIADDGVESAAIALELIDTAGDPVRDFPASLNVLSVSGSNNTVTQPASATNAIGVASGSFVSTGAGDKTASYACAGLAITDTAVVTVSGDSSELEPGSGDTVWYSDNFTDTATWAARRTKYNTLVGIGAPAAIFEAPADPTDTEITPTMVAPGYNGSNYAIELDFPAGFPYGDEVRCNFPIRLIGGQVPMQTGDTLFVDMWMKFDFPEANFLWWKGMMMGHSGGGSGASGDRTQYGAYRTGASLGYCNVNPQSQAEIHMHQEDGAPDAPVNYKRWSNITGAGYLRWTFVFKRNTTTGTTRDGIARIYINGEKVVDASLFGLNNGWMEDRQNGVSANSTSPYPGNVGEKYSDTTGDSCLLLLADENVTSLVFPGIMGSYSQGDGSGKITIGEIRCWTRPA